MASCSLLRGTYRSSRVQTLTLGVWWLQESSDTPALSFDVLASGRGAAGAFAAALGLDEDLDELDSELSEVGDAFEDEEEDEDDIEQDEVDGISDGMLRCERSGWQLKLCFYEQTELSTSAAAGSVTALWSGA